MSNVSLFFLIVVHVVGNLHSFKGPSGRLQDVRLFLRAFVLYSPWIPCEHCQGTSAVECVTAHLRGFEEDLSSETVFWIDELSVEFGYHWLMSLMFFTTHLFHFRFAVTEQYWRTRCLFTLTFLQD